MSAEYAPGLSAPRPLSRGRRVSEIVTAVLRRVRDAEPLGPVRVTVPVIAELALLLVLSCVVGAVLVHAPGDWATLLIASGSIFLLALFSVRSLLPVQSNWSASTFVFLGLALTLGPVGAVAGAVSESLGVMLRTRNGWFRTVFNVAMHFLSGIAAYEVFAHVSAGLGGAPIARAVAGLAAGLALFVVNQGLLAMVIHAANREIQVWTVLRHRLSLTPYNVVYGWSSFGFVVLYEHAGFVGFTALLAPVALLQGAFVMFTRQIRAFDEQRASFAREREALLHKAVEASEMERRRIARDLHDGVVQNLSGMAFAMTAVLSRIRDEGRGAPQDVVELLDQSAQETRQAMKDLRTLMIEIAPPTLRREGLHAALVEILRTLENAGTKTRLELPSNMRLRQDRASLIFRVAQEVLRNVAAHAEASNVSVVLRERDGWAVLNIKDDGKGFTAEEVARRRAEGHVGTNAIVELAEDAGGTLEISSRPGHGTRVTLQLPVES